MRYDAYIFDVDGVLIDHSNSFIPSIVLAVKTILNDDTFNQEHVLKLNLLKISIMIGIQLLQVIVGENFIHLKIFQII